MISIRETHWDTRHYQSLFLVSDPNQCYLLVLWKTQKSLQRLRKPPVYRFELNKKDILLACLSGLFIFVSFPTIEWTGFIWLSLIPFFFAIRDKSPKQAFWIGFITGYVTSATLYYWVIYTLQEFGHLPLWAAILVFLAFCTFCNLQFAIFGYLIRKFPLKIAPLFWLPVLYTVIEFLFPQIFSAYLGACLYKKLWLIQTVDITGIHGMSFLVILVNVFIYELVRWIIRETDVFPKYSFSISVGLMILSCLYSAHQLKIHQELIQQSPKIRAALIQTNIGNLEKMSASQGYQGAVTTSRAVNHRLVMQAAQTSGLDLMILPETAVPGYFTDDHPQNQAYMFELASKAGVPIAFGGYNKSNGPDPKIYNSLFLISSHYQILGDYDKINLLWFGEVFPFSETFPVLKKWFPEVGNFSRGKNIIPLSLTKELKFAPLICLEGLYPAFVRKFVKKGAQFIITITNDSWFGPTSNPYQHRMLHVWRAIENRTPMLRVANTGVSTFIDLTGKIQSETPLFQESILVDEVAIIKEQSFYTIYGDLFAYGLIVLLMVFFIISYYVNRISAPKKNFKTVPCIIPLSSRNLRSKYPGSRNSKSG